MRTPLLVDTSTSFEDYLKRLSKSSKKKYKAARCDLSFNEVPYNQVVMEQFIKLWEKQVVFGFHPKWSVPMSVMNKLNLVMFDIGGIAIHAIEKCGDYAYAHPPLYDKKNNIARYI